MAASTRYIFVSLHPQGEQLSFPCVDNSLNLASLQSVFPQATGLKHYQNSIWKVVPVDAGKFHLPPGIEQFTAISGSLGQARQVVSSGTSLASQIAASFRPPPVIPPTRPLNRSFTSKKKPKKDTRNKTKTYKVVFIKETDLPVSYSKFQAIIEGMIDIREEDDERTVKDHLKIILEGTVSNLNFSDLIILTYNSKKLSQPHCVPGFEWNGKRIKAVVGQGKLYVMVLGYKELHQADVGNDTDDELSQSPLAFAENPRSTQVRNNGLDIEDDDILPSLDRCDRFAGTAQGDVNEQSTVQLQSHITSAPVPLSQVTSESAASTQASESAQVLNFTDAGTPTVQFRPRRSLSLSQRYSQRPMDRETRHQEVVDVFDSEDEELQMEMDPRNIDADIQTVHEAESFKSILQAFQEDTVRGDSKTKLLVQRSRIVETTLKGLDRKSMDFKSRLYIKFSGELGQDEGGPRREFFRLVLKELHESRYFEGPEGEKIFSHDLTLLERGHYRLIGRLVALALAQDGPGLHFLSPDLYDLMVGQNTQVKDADKLLTEEIKSMIKQLRDADNAMKEDAFLSVYGDQLLDLGVPNVYKMARDEKELLVELIKKHHIYYRISGEISQFTSGMNDVNMAWVMVTTHAELFKPVFCFKPQAITCDQMLSMFSINYSEKGSNNRALEEVSIFGWESFLQSIEAGEVDVSFSEVLSFITGADNIPPCGFAKQIDLDFYPFEDQRLPSASTCALQLWIPRVTDPDMVSSMMSRAVKESYGFLKV